MRALQVVAFEFRFRHALVKLAFADGISDALDFLGEADLSLRREKQLHHANHFAVRSEAGGGVDHGGQVLAFRLRPCHTFAGCPIGDSARGGTRARAAVRVIKQLPELSAHAILLLPCASVSSRLVQVENRMLPVHHYHHAGNQIEHFGKLAVVQRMMAVFPAADPRQCAVFSAGNDNRVCL